VYVCNTIQYIDPFAENQTKVVCIQTHDTSATTPAATAGATSVGHAHMTMKFYDDFFDKQTISLNSLPDTPPSINTHTHTQIQLANVGGRCSMNVRVCSLSSAPSLLVRVCLSEFLCVCVRECVCACVFRVAGAHRMIRLVLEIPPPFPPLPHAHPNQHPHTRTHTNVHTHVHANTL